LFPGQWKFLDVKLGLMGMLCKSWETYSLSIHVVHHVTVSENILVAIINQEIKPFTLW
jgi:hypothetical protein